MKNTSIKEQIEKLEKKRENLKLEINRLRKDEQAEQIKEAFNKIMELGKEFGLFRDIEITNIHCFTGMKKRYTITVELPYEAYCQKNLNETLI